MHKPPITPVSRPSVFPIHEEALCAWFGTATAGDRIEYWRGHLAVDVTPDHSMLMPEDRRQLGRVAARAFHLAEEDRVHLVQRRHGDGDYSYILIVRPRRQPVRARFATSILNAGPSPSTPHTLEVA